jgi:hypothetical protein
MTTKSECRDALRPKNPVASNVVVNVRTVITPKRNSEILSTGSSTRWIRFGEFPAKAGVLSLSPELNDGFR